MADTMLKDGDDAAGAFAPGRVCAAVRRSNPKIGSARLTPAERI